MVLVLFLVIAVWFFQGTLRERQLTCVMRGALRSLDEIHQSIIKTERILKYINLGIIHQKHRPKKTSRIIKSLSQPITYSVSKQGKITTNHKVIYRCSIQQISKWPLPVNITKVRNRLYLFRQYLQLYVNVLYTTVKIHLLRYVKIKTWVIT